MVIDYEKNRRFFVKEKIEDTFSVSSILPNPSLIWSENALELLKTRSL